jgi:CRP-like cAMP-binding protein
MEHSTRAGNRLLAALPTADFNLLAPYLRNVSLERDAVLVRSGDRIEQIYFPCSATIAFMLDMPNGQTVATAVIGNEAAAGLLSALGPSRSAATAVVLVAGTSLQISPARFHAAFSHSDAIKDAVQAHTAVLLTQFQHVAACNALHSVDARLARWLLHIHDRVDGDVLPLTQAALSELLGVRRTTVTQVVHKLRMSRAIRSNQRGLIEIDRPRLEAAAMRLLRSHVPQNRPYCFAGRKDASQSRCVDKFRGLKMIPLWPSRMKRSATRTSGATSQCRLWLATGQQSASANACSWHQTDPNRPPDRTRKPTSFQHLGRGRHLIVASALVNPPSWPPPIERPAAPTPARPERGSFCTK